MKAAIYNPYWDTMGGGERYCLGVANAFAKAGYKIDIQWRDKNLLQVAEKRFGVKIQARVVPDIMRGDGYDACFWVSDGSIPTLRSRNNILHFQVPFRNVNGKTLMNKMKFFRIKHVICNSNFTKSFIDNEFGVSSLVIYPPVSVSNFRPKRKINKIVYIGRFSRLVQRKGQDVLIDTFKKFVKRGYRDWELILAGGAEVGGDGFVDELREQSKGFPIRIMISPSFSQIRELLGEAKMFWSASGYGVDEKTSPEKVEHFGITVVEAMAAKAVPFVINKGGHKEIVRHGRSGFLWNTKAELLEWSLGYLGDHAAQQAVSKMSQESSGKFSDTEFQNSFLELIK